MLFAITIYGEDFLPFLTVCLESLRKNHPKDNVTVAWTEIDSFEIKQLALQYPRVKFRKLPYKVNRTDIHTTISYKFRFWGDLLKNSSEKVVCFLDCDTFVYKNITKFTKGRYDILYTWKEGQYGLNTGVLLVKNNSKTRQFLAYWLKEILRISADPTLVAQAVASQGAVDQYVLATALGKKMFKPFAKVKLPFAELTFHTVPCKILNETNSVLLNSGAYIYHYKTAWHSILLRGGEYTAQRSVANSWQLKDLWQETYLPVGNEMTKTLVLNATQKHRNILAWEKLPFESRGIINSEMLAILALIKELDIDIVIESGRARGQSTFVLAKALEKTPVRIFSLDYSQDVDTKFSEKRLKPFKKVSLLYGDANKELAKLVSQFPDKNVAVLLDGPKGKEAFDIFASLVALYPQVKVGFFHDCRKSLGKMYNSGRDLLPTYFDRVFFTDDEDYVKCFKAIDKNCVTPLSKVQMGSFSPYHYGLNKIGSYGPTLGIVWVNTRDRGIQKTKLTKKNPTVTKRARSVLRNLRYNILNNG